MINCDVIRDLMPLYADNLISSTGKALVDRHIRECPECAGLLQAMCTPVEAEPEPLEQSYVDAIRLQKKRQSRRMVLLCALTALVCILGWWIYMETHFYGETPYVITTNEEVILAEMPELKLSEEELALAAVLYNHPSLRTALASGEVTDIPLAQGPEELSALLPANATHSTLSVLSKHAVCVDIFTDEQRIILEYLDVDNSGTVDLIRKTIGIMEKDRDVNTVYSLEYAVGIGRSWCEKQRMRHIWFSFLDF